MLLNTLNAISPVDGRYRSKSKPLHAFFSEYALIKYRVKIEIEYFISLCSHPIPQLESFQHSLFEDLRSIYEHFSQENAKAIKDIEKTTNHDVKAVEYFLKNEFDRLGISEFKEFIHFGLTSQDVNNTAVPLSIKDALESVILPEIEKTVLHLDELATQHDHIPMLSHTHGQAASPSRLGKEIQVFSERVKQQIILLKKYLMQQSLEGQLETLTLIKLHIPKLIGKHLGKNLLIIPWGSITLPTTQIEHYDHLAALCDTFARSTPY